MKFEDLTPKQMEKAKACKTPKDVLALAKEEGYELSDDELSAASGGEERYGKGKRSQMMITDLTEGQVRDIEARLSAFDDGYDTHGLDGSIRIGLEEDGRLVAGLDACVTAFRILYVSTVFVDEEYRRRGIGTQLMREMERRAAAMGVNTIRLDTFSWQGREFYEALGYTCVGQYGNSEDGYSEYFFMKRIG